MPPSSTRRTNSLGCAKTDCHTCAANRRRCDRKRPRCLSCSGRGIVCGGYPMQLTWCGSKPTRAKEPERLEPGVDSFFLDPLTHQVSAQLRKGNSHQRPRRRQKFRFVTDNVSRRKQISPETSRAAERQSSDYIDEIQIPSSIQECNNERDILHNEQSSSVTLLEEVPTDPPSSLTNFSSPSLFSNDLLFGLSDWWSWSSTDSIEFDGLNSAVIMPSGETSSAGLIFGRDEQEFIFQTPPLHENLFKKFEALLRLYDQDFCIVPLTGDIPSNPFRYPSEAFQDPEPLLHAILAVSCHHADRQARKGSYPSLDVADHYNTAMKLYRDELNGCVGSRVQRLLDTTMVLFLYNATQSALSDWASRISDAGKLLERSGGSKIWKDNPRLQAQVIMLLWWDATIALLSRQGCILPHSYVENLLTLENRQYWSFFDLVGCPRELVVHLMQLTSMAQENEIASSMRWTKFDLTPIDEIEASIINWKAPCPGTDYEASEEEMQQRRDRWHCVEAWRYALLIYITRVFRWKRNTTPPAKSASYARNVLEHVNSCRHTAIIQKQALLPLFFAGSETKDEFWRQNVREYCKRWDRICGYDLFNAASSLLEELWKEQDEPCNYLAWWGSVLDKKQHYDQSRGVLMQYCFG